MAEGRLHRRSQLCRLLHPAHAEGRTRPHRLDKQRPAQCFGCRPELLKGTVLREETAPGHPYPRQSRQLVGSVLVHAQGAGQRPAAYQGHTGQFQRPLNRAVLTVPAVENREGQVKSHFPAGAVQQHQGPVPPVQPQSAGHARRLPLPSSTGNGIQRPCVNIPRPLPGDPYRDGAVPLRVHVRQHAVGGLQRHLML